MRAFLLATFLATGLSVGALAQTAEITATCKDGTSWSGTTRRGACSGHRGVQTFGAAPAAASAPSGSQVANPVAPAQVAPPSAVASPAPPTNSAPPNALQSRPTAPVAAGAGGAGQVWVNSSTRVYHCPGTRYYGKTNNGSYMTEAAAKAEGDRPSRGKTCS